MILKDLLKILPGSQNNFFAIYCKLLVLVTIVARICRILSKVFHYEMMRLLKGVTRRFLK